jgi:hypothetical protein
VSRAFRSLPDPSDRPGMLALGEQERDLQTINGNMTLINTRELESD